jgi:hypothetical protein
MPDTNGIDLVREKNLTSDNILNWKLIWGTNILSSEEIE